MGSAKRTRRTKPAPRAQLARDGLVGAVGAATYWGALQYAPPDYSKPLTDAGLIVLGVWLSLMVLHSVLDLIDRARGAATDEAEESPEDSPGSLD